MVTLKYSRPGRPPGDYSRLWITGPNPKYHVMYRNYIWHRVSSRRRGNVWNLSWESWRDLWEPVWESRGRGASNLCMVRIDSEKPWSAGNIELITRREHGQRVRAMYQ